MRVPDEFLECVFFLCVEGSGGWQYGGTGFIVRVPLESTPDAWVQYLVTAKHCVEAAKAAASPLFLRLNTKSGGVGYLEVIGDWLYSDDEGVDVATVPIDVGAGIDQFAYKAIPLTGFATEAIVQQHGIGIGDDLCAVGLFTGRSGSSRNLPIVRRGIIAAMPGEPLQDRDSGFEYAAYLAEVRSIGGLSGSPVFVTLEAGRTHGGATSLTPVSYLLGMIRGHWDYRAIGFSMADLAAINSGIAIITPIQNVLDVLNSPDQVKKRRAAERERARGGTIRQDVEKP